MNIFIPIAPLLMSLIVGLLWEIISPQSQNKRALFWLQAVACVIGIAVVLVYKPVTVSFFNTVLAINSLSLVFQVLFLILGFLTFVLSDQFLQRMKLPFAGELPLLLGVIVTALYGLTISGDFIFTWVLFELISITLYFCVGFFKDSPVARESALKYFTLGVFASAFLTLGLALIYLFTGSFEFATIAKTIQGLKNIEPLLVLGGFLVVVSLGFKLAIVPLHVWVPDVYTGTHTPVTAFMATAVKSMAVYLLVSISFMVLKPVAVAWDSLLQILVFITLLVGSILALTQTDFKRLLAYSSVVNAGYLFLAALIFDAANPVTRGTLLFFLFSYAAATYLVFYCVSLLEPELGTSIAAYRGLWQRSPLYALAIVTGLLSLAGFPFLTGFVAKVYLFTQAASAGKVLLVFFALGTTVVSFYYYALPAIEIFLKNPVQNTGLAKPGVLGGVLIFVLALAVLLGGLFAQSIIPWLL